MLILSSNGNTPGITLPGVQGQEDVIRKAYASARLDLGDTIYVEVREVQVILSQTSTLTSM
jgi:acyl transferase domain-containing protein